MRTFEKYRAPLAGRRGRQLAHRVSAVLRGQPGSRAPCGCRSRRSWSSARSDESFDSPWSTSPRDGSVSARARSRSPYAQADASRSDTAPPEGAMYDAIVIGSGIGGSMAAHRLVARRLAGAAARARRARRTRDLIARTRVATLELSPCTRRGRVPRRCRRLQATAAAACCLGGLSVYFGAAAVRYREADFHEDARNRRGRPAPGGRSGTPTSNRTTWRPRRLMGVAGDDADDPTRPPRSAPFPQKPRPLFPVSSRLQRGDSGRRRDAGPGPGGHQLRREQRPECLHLLPVVRHLRVRCRGEERHGGRGARGRSSAAVSRSRPVRWSPGW